MAEKRLIIDGMELKYNGLFDLDSLLTEIDNNLEERGYSKAEKRRQERVEEHGKEFSMELRPSKIKTDYYSLMIKLRIHITDLEDVEVERDGKKTQLNKGNVTMLFDAWATTDYRNRWVKKPFYYFLLILVDKFIKKLHSDKFHGELVEDTHYIHDNIKAHLNLHRF